jgi:hypothetical protein
VAGRSGPARWPSLSGRHLFVFALLALTVLVLRRPASLLHADFWAEDGWRWYPDAYNEGWRTLFSPYAGYQQFICRLVGLAALPFPLSWAPTIFSLCALGIQVGAATLFVSSRLDDAWPHRSSRILFAFLYLLLPNSFEVYANLTNAQWHLSLLAFLLLVARPARTLPGRIADAAMLALSGLSGPFCLFLFPVAVWEFWRKRDRDSAGKAALLLVCCLAQASMAIETGRTAAPNLGAGPRRFAAIVALQIVLGTILGRHAMPHVIHSVLWQDNVIPVLLTIGAAGLTAVALRSGSALLRQFCLYAAFIFAAGLLRPATGSSIPAWQLFGTPDIGDRYYVIPMLAWIGVLFSLTAGRMLVARRTAYVLLALVLVAIPGDLHFATGLAASRATGFAAQARQFASAPPGSQMRFPIRPLGVPPMVLTKR